MNVTINNKISIRLARCLCNQYIRRSDSYKNLLLQRKSKSVRKLPSRCSTLPRPKIKIKIKS